MAQHLPPVRITHRFPFSPERVFNAWVEPDIMRRWLFASPENDIRAVKSERWVGGEMSVLEYTEGEAIAHYGIYRQIEPPRRLVFSLEVPTHFPGETMVTVEIEPDGDGALIRFGQAGVAAEVTEDAWRVMFDTLEHVLEEEPDPARRPTPASEADEPPRMADWQG